jgi:hypothetical protein
MVWMMMIISVWKTEGAARSFVLLVKKDVGM